MPEYTKDELLKLLAEKEKAEVKEVVIADIPMYKPEVKKESKPVPPPKPIPPEPVEQPLPKLDPIPYVPPTPPPYIPPSAQVVQSPERPQESEKVPEWLHEKKQKPPRFFNRYPIMAILFEARSGGGTFAFFDRVGRFKKKIGIGFEYRLKKKKKRIPTSQFENIIESNKAKVLLIDHPEEDVFRPMKVENAVISAKETAWKEIFMNNVERAQTLLNRKGFFEKFMPLILLIVFGVMMIMALYVVRTDIAIIIDQIRSAASSAATNLRSPI